MTASAEPYLQGLARELGDPGLFPPDVVQLHERGRVRKARRELLRHARSYERNDDRARKQRAVANDLRHWLTPLSRAPAMGTFNGIGARLLGRHQPAKDGTCIATLWITFLYVPLWPISAYLVLPEGDNLWSGFARSPLPPMARTARRVAGGVLAALVALVLWNSYWAGSHVDVVVYNGFDRPLVAHVGEAQRMVDPRSPAVFEDLPVEPTTFGASWDDSGGWFDSVSADLAGHAGDHVIYNVADRAVLELGYIVYGDAEPRASRVLGTGPVHFIGDKIHYRFVPPPDSMRVSEGESIEKSVLAAADDGMEPVAAVSRLVEQDRLDQALVVARAELLVHPEDGMLAAYAAQVLLAGDFTAQLALLRGCLDRAPDAVDLHRAYQDLWGDDKAGIRAQYEGLLAANPSAPMYHYLVGRLEPVGSTAAAAHFRAALALDPEYPPVHRALAYHALLAGDWSVALEHYERFASTGPAAAREALATRLRLLRRLRRDPTESLSLLAEMSQHDPDAARLDYFAAHLRVEQDPDRAATEALRLVEHLEASLGRQGRRYAPNVRANLALTAGDVDGARQWLEQVAAFEDRSAQTALRLALSAGAAPDDRQLLFWIPNWYQELDAPWRLVALELLEPEERSPIIDGSQDPDFVAIARLLETPADLVRPERLLPLIDEQPDLWALVYFAAARRLAGQDVPGAARAHRFYLDQARSLALPGELPYLGEAR